MTARLHRLLMAAGVVGSVGALQVSDAAAQAFTPAEKHLDVNTNYIFSTSNQIEGVTDADTTSHTFQLDLDYGLPANLGLNVNVPFIMTDTSMTRWHGQDTDDGSPGKEKALTDLSVGLRRPFEMGDITLTPGLGGTVPLTDYQVHGNASVGTGLWEAHLSLDTAWVPASIPGVFALVGLEFTDGEKPQAELFKDFSRARIDVDITAGYQINNDLTAYGIGVFRNNFDGFEFSQFGAFMAMEPGVPDEDQQTRHQHENALKERYLYLGAGASYQLNLEFAVNAAVLATVINDNTHNPLSLQLGLSYAFSFADDGVASVEGAEWEEEWDDDDDDSEASEPADEPASEPAE